ncbi:MAG: PadR family transcriptional regulator, regulatory protein PadR [Actinomycetota bacterium]|nr:PadR family transcriptional regulator, regulatory protein PadR [Actinomycetota bacterium]
MARREQDAPPSGLPSNYLKACALLLISEAPAHGYQLLARLSAVGPAGFDLGALYRVLRAMEDDGLVASSWEDSALGPARRVYRITDRGRQVLDAEAEALSEVYGHMATFIRRFTRIGSRPIVAA